MADKQKVSVVLADDEDHIRELMKTVMESMGCQVVAEAKNGREAVEMYEKFKPNIVALDINMPEMDGIEALKAIIAINSKAFVIMLTSLGSMNLVQDCLDAGAMTYIRKDTPLDEIKKLMKEAWKDYLSEK